MTPITLRRAAFLFAAGLLIFTSAPTRASEKAGSVSAAAKASAAGKPLALTKTKKSQSAKVGGSARKAKAGAKYASLKTRARKARAVKQAKARSKAPVEREMTAAVANANARMPGVDARGEAAMVGSAPLEIAAAEQLNELDKSLAAPRAEDEPRRITTQLVVNDQPQTALPVVVPEPPRPAAQVSSVSKGDAWAQSSLIGKIFIAFGGMLTLASAARMLVA